MGNILIFTINIHRIIPIKIILFRRCDAVVVICWVNRNERPHHFSMIVKIPACSVCGKS